MHSKHSQSRYLFLYVALVRRARYYHGMTKFVTEAYRLMQFTNVFAKLLQIYCLIGAFYCTAFAPIFSLNI